MAKQVPLAKLIPQWEEAKKQLDIAKATELALRNTICAQAAPQPKEGANTLDLGDLKVKVTHVLNYLLDEATLADTLKRLPAQLAAKLVRYKPELVKAPYRDLTDAQKLILSDALVVKPGQDQLEIVRPKGK